MTEITEINEKAWTPEYTLRHTLEKAENIEDLAITIRMKDGSLTTMVSTMEAQTLALLCKRLELRLELALVEDYVDSEDYNG